MELSNNSSPVLADPITITKSNHGIPSTLFPYSASAVAFSSSLHLISPRKKTIPGKLDDVRTAGWLDAMISSSPTCKKLNKDLNFYVDLDENESSYSSWLIKFPSALSSFEKIAQHAQGKKIALFLDYDGTLSPIVDEPDNAFMSNAMRSAVKEVSAYFPTAIISGRCRDKVYEFIGLPELHYAGSHGMDIMGPMTHSVPVDVRQNSITTTDEQEHLEIKRADFVFTKHMEKAKHPCTGEPFVVNINGKSWIKCDSKGNEVNLFQPASEFSSMIDEVYKSLIESTAGINGVKVENNKFCASVHYRLVDEKSWPVVAQLVYDIIKEYPRLRLTHGRKVLEIRPVINWNKGKAVEFLLESLGLNNCNDVLPIYVGDDRTDEDAFKVLRDGNKGYGILVSSVPKETSAIYTLRDPSEVMKFLTSLVRWKRSLEEDKNQYI